MARRRRKLVHVSQHARDQYRRRGGEGSLQKIVETRLRTTLKRGAAVTGNLIVEVPVSRELKAICTPGVTGGWLCITMLGRDMETAREVKRWKASSTTNK
jgi:hypothetical protein